MRTLILHEFEGSPFSEKVRLMLGYKGLPWRSVEVPMIMPKPDVVALTGGYRKTPFLQIGADVFCDTALIAAVLERLAPTPTLFPADAPLAPIVAQWADGTLFHAAVPYATQPAGRSHLLKGVPPEVLQGLAADRAAFMGTLRRQSVADATANLRSLLKALDRQLSDGRPYLLGMRASVADFAVAHCAWFVRRGGPVADILEPHPHFTAWLERMLAIGHGVSRPMSSAEAIAVAAAAAEASSYAACSVAPGQGFDHGQSVTVSPIDYGVDPVAGMLVGLGDDEVVVERIDARAGRVHVHFPRHGFQIRQEQT